MAEEDTESLVRRLYKEEQLRASVRKELEGSSSREPSWLSENVKWILITLLIPALTWLVGYQLQERERLRTEAQKEIERSRQIAEASVANARNDVTAMTALLPALSDTDARKSGLALVVLTRLRDAQQNDPKLIALFAEMERRIDALRNSSDPQQKNLGARQLEAVQTASGTTQQINARPIAAVQLQELTQVSATRPGRVYLQIFEEGLQRDQAIAVQKLLRDDGIPVPAIENVGSVLPSGTLPPQQIRFFNAQDLGSARWIRVRLQQTGFGTWPIVRARSSGSVPEGQVEIWWSNSKDRSE
jgi:hypothetical protein